MKQPSLLPSLVYKSAKKTFFSKLFMKNYYRCGFHSMSFGLQKKTKQKILFNFE